MKKEMFVRYQYRIWCVYFGLAAVLLAFGLLAGESDIIKLFVGAGLVCAFFAGMVFRRAVAGARKGRKVQPEYVPGLAAGDEESEPEEEAQPEHFNF